MNADARPLLSLDEALARLVAGAVPHAIVQTESVSTFDALGRVLAAEVLSALDVPPEDNSSMDGYALHAASVPAAGTVLTVSQRIPAGVPGEPLQPGTAARIFTGGQVPPGADAIVMQEECDALPAQNPGELGQVRVNVMPQHGQWIRRRGEDVRLGSAVLHRGERLTPQALGMAASVGAALLPVVRRPRVALFSTGDEIRTLGQPLDPGCVYDSNRYSLMGALQRLGMEVVDLGLVRDDPQALHSVLEQATARADAVVTSGGVSMGDADHTRDVLAQRGQVAFWKVAMRPGRPFAFGPLRRSASADGSTADVAGAQAPVWLFALPGNPVAALVTFYVFAREALLSLAGATATPLPVLQARCLTPIRKRPGRTEFQRAIVEPGPAGWQVRLTGSQGAGVLRSMSEANALVVLGHEQASVAAGDLVDVWLFDGLT